MIANYFSHIVAPPCSSCHITITVPFNVIWQICFFFVQFIVLALFVAAALAAPAGPDADAQVVRYESDNIGVDGYNYA